MRDIKSVKNPVWKQAGLTNDKTRVKRIGHWEDKAKLAGQWKTSKQRDCSYMNTTDLYSIITRSADRHVLCNMVDVLRVVDLSKE